MNKDKKVVSDKDGSRKQAIAVEPTKRESKTAADKILFQKNSTTKRPDEPQVFIIIRRKKLTHYMTFGESATFQDVKLEIEKCTQVKPEDIALYYSKNGELQSHELTLYQSGFLGSRHPPTSPALFYVGFRQPDGKFEEVEVTNYLAPQVRAPHVIEGPGGAPTEFPMADYAQKLMQELAIKHGIGN